MEAGAGAGSLFFVAQAKLNAAPSCGCGLHHLAAACCAAACGRGMAVAGTAVNSLLG